MNDDRAQENNLAMRRRRYRTTRLKLERAARQLFAERGFADVSADEIVAAAGMTRGALHYHYGDKRGLLIAVLEQVERENSAEIEEAIAARESGRLVDVDIPILAQLLISSAIEAGFVVAGAQDPIATRERAMHALMMIVSGVLATHAASALIGAPDRALRVAPEHP
ncbi:TetR/AcrR family transcriptional regulator [Nocardia sp. NBC_00565]|uniref:TetR/AcrR family transcriptional regulator n=1 Tax=Nocardia sp. NBC_00565 TaxID=2975993 RepID=UPI002E8249E1|nr:helix-turn-helix domain-containing protein [Nocardia sp. NBC_00565]WUC06631.1 TetR/AcrR family transcriptional regulator [Nocardia sp. NBC_00565]